MKNIFCKICKCSNIKKAYNLYDDRYGYQGFFNVYQCKECKHSFLNYSFTDSELSNIYSKYYPRESLKITDYKPHIYTGSFRNWLDGAKSSAYTYIPKNVHVLDIGCGFGESIGYHVNRGCKAYGVEADTNVQKIAERFNLNIKIGLFNRKLYSKDFFDYVTMDQVLEHTQDPIKTLQDINEVLKPNGFFVASVPNANSFFAKILGKKWIHWHAPYHLQFFSSKSIEIIAEKSNFEVVCIKTVTNSEWLYYQWKHLIFYPMHGKKSVFWDNKRTNSNGNNSLNIALANRIIALIKKTKLNHVITRIIDIANKGDNFIIILRKK